MSAAVRTTCPYCGVGCGVLATPTAAGVAIAGDPAHPANFGRLCSKGSALGETVSHDGRLLHPRLRGRRASWDAALDAVATGFGRAIAAHGPDAVALYVSGQLLTEDYYVANKLAKGWFGTANIDTNSRLCMASAVAGHKRAFGEDVVPVDYADLENADLVVLAGSNLAWCHPILYQRLAAARRGRAGPKVVVIDPRRTATCELADLHLPVQPGADAWLFNGLLAFLYQHGVADAAFVNTHTDGAEVALRAAQASAPTLESVARACGVAPAALSEFYRLFARTERAVTVFSQGVNQSSSGTDKVNAIINCHLLTGRIGKPGQGPFSVTGQPNAMGGREVGGLSGTLAAHMDFAPADRARVQAFWGSPRIAAGPGLKAVDLFEAIHDGRVRAVWIMATNPVVSLPDADRVREALRRCELVVVSDCVARTDTAELAHVLLPAAAWGEKDGTVTNSERRISRQRAFLPPAGEARPDWWIVCEVARRMGFAGFDYDGPAAIFDEHARLSAHGNAGARAFDLGALTGLTPAQYDALEPRQWPDRGRPFADGRFAHPDGRARFVPVTPRPPVHAADESFPLLLNTGRVRDQWHTMTRTGRSPRLAGHRPEPYVDLHPQDAMLSGVREHELARVATRWGAMVARVRCSGEMRRGQAFVPIHWNDQTASDARVGALVSPAVDPVSGEPEFKHTPARVEEFRVHWHGFAFARRPLRLDDVAWWARVQGRRFVRHEMAGRRPLADPAGWARRLLGVGDAGADWLDCSDPTAGVYRAALLVDDRVEACVFVSPRPDLPSRSWLSSLFDKDALDDLDRVGLLVGAPAAAGADGGAVVCSCHGVGRRTLMAAIRERELATVEEVGQCLKAGSNCGSCVPEIQSLLAEARHEEAGA